VTITWDYSEVLVKPGFAIENGIGAGKLALKAKRN
jgi:hypothetical protein